MGSVSPSSSASQGMTLPSGCAPFDAVAWATIVGNMREAGASQGTISRVMSRALDAYDKYVVLATKAMDMASVVPLSGSEVSAVRPRAADISVVSSVESQPSLAVARLRRSLRPGGLASTISIADPSQVEHNSRKHVFASRPGYCYLWAVVIERIPLVIEMLGPNPVFSSVVAMDADWFEYPEMLRALAVDEELPHLHVRNGGVGKTNFLTLCRSVVPGPSYSANSLVTRIHSLFTPMQALFVNDPAVRVGGRPDAAVRLVVSDDGIPVGAVSAGVSTSFGIVGSRVHGAVLYKPGVLFDDVVDLGQKDAVVSSLSASVFNGEVEVRLTPPKDCVRGYWVMGPEYRAVVTTVFVEDVELELPLTGSLVIAFDGVLCARVAVSTVQRLLCRVHATSTW